MGTGDAQNLKNEAEILARQSRPQRSSTWIPKTRDWRYATGVIQHDDFEDMPKSRSVWDTLDYDFQAGGDKSSQRGSRSDSGAGSEVNFVEITELVQTPKRAVSKFSIESPVSAAQKRTAYKPMNLPKGSWRQVTRLTRSQNTVEDGGEVVFDTTALVVRLRFTGKNKAQIKEILEKPARPTSPVVCRNMTPPDSSPNTPVTARTAETIQAPHILDSIESLYAFPLFKRTWVDETYDFNIATIRSKIRSADKVFDELGSNYQWYADAVPADAIFPPGVAISAKEIIAFYPHHVRWKGVMVRLTNNDYRGADIMGMQALVRGAPSHPTTAAHMNNYQRDTVKTAIPGFKTTSYKGTSDRNMRTEHLAPGPHIGGLSRGYTLPTFEDLVRGLRRLPSGLDARGLSQCLSWYLNIRNAFTPRLELNVLHVQSLIRALREPLKPFGPQNLDRNALEEWRNKGTFETVEIEDKKRLYEAVASSDDHQVRSRLHLNLDEEDVSLKVTLPIRHILTFPFMALHGVVGEALKLGIGKAEMRQASQQEEAVKRALEAKWVASVAENDHDHEVEDEELGSNVPVQTVTVTEEPKKLDRIPKRPLPFDANMLSAHKRLSIPKGPRNTSVPLKLAPAPLRSLVPAPPQDAGHLSRSWNSPALSSMYTPRQLPQDNVHGRRDVHARQQDQNSGRTYPTGNAHGRGGLYQPGYSNYHNGNQDRR